MSGWSDSVECPKCGGDNLMISEDSKPHSCVCGECLDCGFKYWTEDGQMTLDEVNERRADYDMDPLKKL